MNIRNLLTGAAAAIAITIGGAAIAPEPAQAGGVCYFETSRQALGYGDAHGCHISSYRNANGHHVWQVTWHDGVVSRYVFWRNGAAEIFSGGRRYLGSWTAHEGKTIIFHSTGAVTGLYGVPFF